jgi:hypothetical protein
VVEWSSLQQRLSFTRSGAVVGVDHAESEPVRAYFRGEQQRRDPDRSTHAGRNRRRQAANGRDFSRAGSCLAQSGAPAPGSGSIPSAALSATTFTEHHEGWRGLRKALIHLRPLGWKRETHCASILSLFSFTMRKPAWCPAFLPHRQPRGCASTKIACYWGTMPLSARWSGSYHAGLPRFTRRSPR